jgi:hypothetical protein
VDEAATCAASARANCKGIGSTGTSDLSTGGES